MQNQPPDLPKVIWCSHCDELTARLVDEKSFKYKCWICHKYAKSLKEEEAFCGVDVWYDQKTQQFNRVIIIGHVDGNVTIIEKRIHSVWRK